ncbi:hypothetical protein [uncultured Thiothrix sp.]|uniref:hypothetical protein n=1 Tax=uncultured Thiothrix sp. TaxID=223185 RepID=UPI002610001F|nr:hypothetical protein [uncultured Thiothrix sp.]
MNPLSIDRHCTVERLHDDLESIYSLLWLAIDSIEQHKLTEIDHVTHGLRLATDKAWAQMSAAKKLQNQLYQEFLESNQPSKRAQQEVQA